MSQGFKGNTWSGITAWVTSSSDRLQLIYTEQIFFSTFNSVSALAKLLLEKLKETFLGMKQRDDISIMFWEM